MAFHVLNPPKHRFAGVHFAPLFSDKAEGIGAYSGHSGIWTWIAARVPNFRPARLAVALGRFRAHRRQFPRRNDLRRRAYRAWLTENPQAAALADKILVTDVALKLLLVWVVVVVGAFIYPAVPNAGVVVMASVPVALWLYRWVADQRERDTVAAAIGTGISMPEQLKLLSGLSGLAPATPSIRPRVDDETIPAGNAVVATISGPCAARGDHRGDFERCAPKTAKRIHVVPASHEARLLTRRAHSARGEVTRASEHTDAALQSRPPAIGRYRPVPT